MIEHEEFDEDEVILDEASALEEEEDLFVDITTMQFPVGDEEFRGFGIQEDGPTEAEDAEREFVDTVIGMCDPRILETHELDERTDRRLVPKSYHPEFAEYLEMQQDRMGTGVIDDGREVGIGSYMSPGSVLRMLIGLKPIDIFSIICTTDQDSEPVMEPVETIEVESEFDTDQVCSTQAVLA